MKTETSGPSRARNVEEGRFTARKASNGGGVENVACGGQDGKTRILDQGPSDVFNLDRTWYSRWPIFR